MPPVAPMPADSAAPPADMAPPTGGPPTGGPPTGGPPADMGPPEVAAPPPPAEGYSEKCVKDLLKALGLALKAATKALGREEPALPTPPKEVFEKGKMRQPLPAFIVQEIAMLLDVAAKLGGKVEGRYDVDIMELLASDDGIDRLSVLLELFAKDKVLLAALKEAQKAGPVGGPPEMEEAEEVVEETPAGEVEEEAMSASEYQ
jgi:hypothetical protein